MPNGCHDFSCLNDTVYFELPIDCDIGILGRVLIGYRGTDLSSLDGFANQVLTRHGRNRRLCNGNGKSCELVKQDHNKKKPGLGFHRLLRLHSFSKIRNDINLGKKTSAQFIELLWICFHFSSKQTSIF